MQGSQWLNQTDIIILQLVGPSFGQPVTILPLIIRQSFPTSWKYRQSWSWQTTGFKIIMTILCIVYGNDTHLIWVWWSLYNMIYWEGEEEEKESVAVLKEEYKMRSRWHAAGCCQSYLLCAYMCSRACMWGAWVSVCVVFVLLIMWW